MLTSHEEIVDHTYFEQQYRFVAPCKALADSVAYYWQLDLRNVQANHPYFNEHIFANLHTSLVFNLGTAFGVKSGASKAAYGNSVLIGQHTQSIHYHHGKGNYLVGIKFKPAGINQLLSIPTAELHNQVITLQHLFKRTEIEEHLAEQTDFTQQALLLDAFLMRQFSKQSGLNHKAYLVKKALEELVQQKQMYKVSEIASELFTTKRSLERYFSAELGVNPKQCINITRFREALKAYSKQGASADMEMFGYCDFSHFMKDYRKYTS